MKAAARAEGGRERKDVQTDPCRLRRQGLLTVAHKSCYSYFFAPAGEAAPPHPDLNLLNDDHRNDGAVFPVTAFCDKRIFTCFASVVHRYVGTLRTTCLRLRLRQSPEPARRTSPSYFFLTQFSEKTSGKGADHHEIRVRVDQCVIVRNDSPGAAGAQGESAKSAALHDGANLVSQCLQPV